MNARAVFLRNLPALVRAVLLGALASTFWIPASHATNGHFPAPLDDVYIYFQIARSTSEGCVLCFGEEAGPTTAATSPTYALVLACVAFFARSPVAMGWAVAALTWLLLVDTSRTLERLCVDKEHAEGILHRIFAILVPLLPFTLPILNWSLLSGMESAWIAALMARSIAAVNEAQASSPEIRPSKQTRAGLVLSLLAVSRPELSPMAFAFMVSVLHASGRLAGTGSLPRSVLRTVLPAALTLSAYALFSTFAAGSTVPAGALRKVVLYDPTATGLQRGIVLLTNTLRLFVEGFEIAWGTLPLLLIFGVIAASLTTARSRRLAIPLLLGGLASFVLVSFNRTAPFQNLRYLAPTYLSILFVAVLGLAQARKAKHRAWCALSVGAASASVVLMIWRGHTKQVNHYASAAKNIHEQQVTVGLALRDDPLADTLFVGDAGAIPYFSEKPTLDGLGLGGWKKLPFARASVLGEGAVAELIERLPPADRPDTLAVYTSWWPQLTGGFGTRVGSVRIAGNVICADAEKTTYRADWALLEQGPPGPQVLDFADLVSEAEHQLEFHGETEPRVGFFILADPSGTHRFDGTRPLSTGDHLSFRIDPSLAPAADSMLALDWPLAPGADATWQVRASGFDQEQVLMPEGGPGWRTLRVVVPAHTSEVHIEVLRGRVDVARVLVAR